MPRRRPVRAWSTSSFFLSAASYQGTAPPTDWQPPQGVITCPPLHIAARCLVLARGMHSPVARDSPVRNWTGLSCLPVLAAHLTLTTLTVQAESPPGASSRACFLCGTLRSTAGPLLPTRLPSYGTFHARRGARPLLSRSPRLACFVVREEEPLSHRIKDVIFLLDVLREQVGVGPSRPDDYGTSCFVSRLIPAGSLD